MEKQQARDKPPKRTNNTSPRKKSPHHESHLYRRSNLTNSVHNQPDSKLCNIKNSLGTKPFSGRQLKLSISVKRTDRAGTVLRQKASPLHQQDLSHQGKGMLRPKQNLSLNHHSLNMRWQSNNKEETRHWKPPKLIKRIYPLQKSFPEDSLCKEDLPAPTPREATERWIVLNAESLLRMNRLQQE